MCTHTCVWEPRSAPCRLGALGVRTLPSATPDPLYYPSYIMVGGRRGSLLKGIAVASWRSTLVKGDLSPSSQPPSKMSLGLDTGRGLGAGRLGCSPYLPGLPALPVPAPCSDFILPPAPVGPDYVSSSLTSVCPSPCFQAASFPCHGR